MRKFRALLIATTLFTLFCTIQYATAAPSTPPPTLNWGGEVNPGQCETGKMVLNVIFDVTNDLDSAVGGGFWATDNYRKHIQVRQTASDTFCAVVRYIGSFVTDAGASPEGTDTTIASGIEGTFEGGYRATITGALNPTPAYNTKGNIGTFDYGCDITTDPGDYSSCGSIFGWVGTYFTSAAFTYDWWGWIYHGGSNGTWVNSQDGNQGDITD